jgi:hypothetical protein
MPATLAQYRAAVALQMLYQRAAVHVSRYLISATGSRMIWLPLPLTGIRCVHRIITDCCVLDVTPVGLDLVELAPEVTVDEVQALTEPHLLVRGDPKSWRTRNASIAFRLQSSNARVSDLKRLATGNRGREH